MVPWFFVSTEALQQQTVFLPPEVFHHLNVLRLQKGDRIVLSDGNGTAFKASLTGLEASKGEAVILGEALPANEPLLQITLFPGITKGEKIEQVIRHSVELGVKKIVPVISKRSVVRLSRQKKEERSRRWQKIARSAAGQCRRSFIPSVALPLEFDEMLDYWHKEKFEAIIVPWEEEKVAGMHRTLNAFPSGIKKIGVFTGPEGGISPEEMEQMRKIPEVYAVSLGPRILRAETAPLAVLSILMCHFAW